MPISDPSYPNVTDAELLEGMRTAAALGALVLIHAESESLLQANRARLQREGRTDVMAHPESRPPFVEEEAVHRALFLAASAGVRVQIVHGSSPVSVDLVERCAATRPPRHDRGLLPPPAPGHGGLPELGTLGLLRPALRERELVEGLWARVLRGEVHSLVSDHAAYTREEKERGLDDMLECPLGCQVIQETVPLVLSEAVHHRGMSLADFARFSATNSARAAGLYPRKGTILPAPMPIWPCTTCRRSGR